MKQVNSFDVKIWSQAEKEGALGLIFREAPTIDRILRTIDALMVGQHPLDSRRLAIFQQVLIASGMDKSAALWHDLQQDVIVAGVKVGAFFVKHVEEWIEEPEAVADDLVPVTIRDLVPVRSRRRSECDLEPGVDVPGVDF